MVVTFSSQSGLAESVEHLDDTTEAVWRHVMGCFFLLHWSSTVGIMALGGILFFH